MASKILPDGCVSITDVLLTLQHASSHGNFSLSIEGNTVTIVQNGVPEVYDLPDIIGRRMLQRLANKYAVRIEWFYHPHMLASGGNC